MYPISQHNYNGNIKTNDFAITLSVSAFSAINLKYLFSQINSSATVTHNLSGLIDSAIVTIDQESFNNTLYFWAQDVSNNIEPVNTLSDIKLDKTAPYKVLDVINYRDQILHSSHARQIKLEMQDRFSANNNMYFYYYRQGTDSSVQSKIITSDTSLPALVTSFVTTIDERPEPSLTTAVCIWVSGTDLAGHTIPDSVSGTATDPLIVYTINDLTPLSTHDYDDSIKNQDFALTITATSNSGFPLKYIFAKLNNDSLITKTTSSFSETLTLTIDTEALDHSLVFWARDDADNIEPFNNLYGIKLDKTAPHSVSDVLSYNGQTFNSSNARPINIEIEDNLANNETINLHYFRQGTDSAVQTAVISCNEPFPRNLCSYTTTIDERPDNNLNTTAICVWISGSDAAGNDIPIGLTGSATSPLVVYYIDDVSPVFLSAYTPNIFSGTVSTVLNLGPTSCYQNNGLINLEVTLSEPGFNLTADFSELDSNFNANNISIIHNTTNTYGILYTITSTNAFDDQTNIAIPITASDTVGNSTVDQEFQAGLLNSCLAFPTIFPTDLSTSVPVDTQITLTFTSTIEPLTANSASAILLDENNAGVPRETIVEDNVIRIIPYSRLNTDSTYTVIVTPKIKSVDDKGIHIDYPTSFTTVEFELPIIKDSYVITDSSGLTLDIDSTSLKIQNGDVSVEWSPLPINWVNNKDLKEITLISSNTAAFIEIPKAKDTLFLASSPATISVDNLNHDNPSIYHDHYTLVVKDNNILDPNLITFFNYNSSLIFRVLSFDSYSVKEGNTMWVEDFYGEFYEGKAKLKWNNPESDSFRLNKIIKKEYSAPSDIDDGEETYSNDGVVWIDSFTNTISTYYGIFSLNEEIDLVDNFNLSPETVTNVTSVSLVWAFTGANSYEFARVLRKENAIPEHSYDGVLAYEGVNNAYTDFNLSASQTYGYRVFLYKVFPNYSIVWSG